MRSPAVRVCAPAALLLLLACGPTNDDDDANRDAGRPADCTTLGCAFNMECGADGSCHCGAGTCTDGGRCDRLAASCVEALPELCAPGTAWAAGTTAFREATASWGLDALAVEGTRINAADVDGDGWADLFVRRGGTADNYATDGGVRGTWLLHNGSGTHFEDVTRQSGIAAARTAGADGGRGRPAEVAAFGDVDNDGDLDVFTGITVPNPATQPESAELMLNNGDGTFALGPVDSPLRRAAQAVARAGAAFTDVDRDGVLDLWVTDNSVNYEPQQDELFRGGPGAVFTNVTSEYGLTTRPWATLANLNGGKSHSNAWSAAACDLNNDGTPELLAASYGRAPNHLWQGIPYGDNQLTFLNRSVASGYALDARTDWTDNESARCWCKLHRSDADCAGVPLPAHITCTTDADAFRWNHATDREAYRLGGNSGTTVCVDVDNDGDLDLLTTEIKHWDVGQSSDPSELLFNNGASDVVFDRPGREATGLTRPQPSPFFDEGDMTAAVFDFDNDGRPDIYLGSADYDGTRGWLYWQQPDHVFAAVPLEQGIDHRSSHGIAVADFDRDGDLDVVVGHSRNRCTGADHCYPTANARLFENVLGQDGNWVQLALVGGTGSNRMAVGARVTVATADQSQVQEVEGGHGHYGMQHDAVLHFGLGAACRADVTVRWPDRALTTQRFEVQAGYRYRVEQGQLPQVVR
ncbi:MAG: CRTAC1 family protein [Deltaproteobacteria bacterium]|nr:CRTAC1 family protein [Deltaproteobacteria bacterium]